MDMKRWCAALVGCLAFASHAAPQTPASQATAPSPYDRIVDDAVAHYRLPGIAVGVVEDGKVVYTRTVGEVEVGSGQPITSESVFKIASNTKAMTASVLARLV